MTKTLIILMLLFSQRILALDVASLQDHRGHQLGRDLALWHNRGDAALEDEVLSGRHNDRFTYSDSFYPGIGFEKGELWARFTLVNERTETVRLWLEQKNPLVDQISVFAPDADGIYKARHQGDKVDFQSREISYRMPAFSLDVPPGTHTYYVRTTTAGSNMMALFLWKPRAFDQHRWNDAALLNGMLGVLLALFCYNLFLAFSLKSRTYHYYSAFLFFMFCMQFCMAGLPALFLDFSLGTWLANRGFLYVSNLAGVCAILVTGSFLNTAGYMPRWHSVLRVLLGLTCAIMVLGLFASYNVFAFSSSTFAGVYCTALLTASLRAVGRRYGPARFYTLAWFFILGATVLNTLHYQGIFHPSLIVSFNSLPGAVLEGILMSLALADRVNFIREKADRTIHKLNAELSLHITEVEKIVAERTLTIRAILDNVPSGLLIVNREGTVLGGHSKSCQKLLDAEAIEGQCFAKLLRLEPAEAAVFRMSVEQVFSGSMPLDVALQQIPSLVKRGRQTLQLGAHAVEDATGTIQHILFSIEDVTELRVRQAESRRHGVLIHILKDIVAFRQFIASSHEAVQKLKLPSDARQKKFILHTLKGNSSVFKLHQVARAIHRMEERDQIGAEEVASVEQEFEKFLTRHKKLLKTDWGRAFEELSIPMAKLNELIKLANAMGSPTLSQRIQGWMEEVSQPLVSSLVAPMIASSRRSARQLGKAVQIHTQGDDIRSLNAQETFIIEALTHLLRNSIVHGIEKDREALGKDRTGRIDLLFEADETALRIHYRDDGRGLNRSIWETAARERLRLQDKEIAQLNLHDLVSKVVQSNFSTQTNLTMEAGRGIGLGGFLQAVADLNGHYTLESKEGEGFRLDVVIPRRSYETLGTAV